MVAVRLVCPGVPAGVPRGLSLICEWESFWLLGAVLSRGSARTVLFLPLPLVVSASVLLSARCSVDLRGRPRLWRLAFAGVGFG